MDDFSQFGLGGMGMPGGLPMPNPIEPDEVREKAKPMAEEVFSNWELLCKIVERHEATIQRRWIKKSKPKRREILLAAWPRMSESHRPDVAAFRLGRTGDAARDACMWPNINLEDLSKTEPLLLMLNARGRASPDAFAIGDVDFTTFGQISRVIDMPRFLNLYSMLFLGRKDPQSYGELVSWDDEPEGCTWNERRVAVHPGEGLWILEIQSRLYRFLVDVSKSILHDVENLTDPNMAIPPEPPLVTGNPEDSYASSLAVTALEGPYRLPARLDLHRLKSIIIAKLHEAQDHLWALREDPGYFNSTLQDWKDHRQEMLPDTNGQPHPVHAQSPDVFWQRVVGNLISSALFPVVVWNSLMFKLSELFKLKEVKYRDRTFRGDEEIPKDYAMAFCKLKHHLRMFRPGPITDLKMGWVASPPMRPYWRREPPPNATTTQIRVVSLPNPQRNESVTDLMWVIQSMFDEQKLFLAGLPTLLDEVERVMKKDRDASQMISSWVAKQISDLAVISEFERQIDLFQPWAATFDTVAAENQEAIDRDFHDTVRDLRPVNDLKIGLQATRLAMPQDGKFKYPAEKRRNKENVETMRRAESALDAFWASLRHDLEGRNGMPATIIHVLRRQVYRTPEWVEPAKTKAASKPDSDATLAAPFGGLSMQDGPKEKPAQPKTKGKTKGTARPTASQAPVQAIDEPKPENKLLFKVDKRALKVFSTLFFNPATSSSPGEVSWTDFLYAMQTVGFHMEKLYGSAWKFTPQKLDVENSIQIHEPHPASKLPFVTARRIGRRLNREYGWTGETFAPA